MLEFRKKKRIQKILYSPIVLLILAIILVLLFRGVLSVYKKEKLTSQNLKQDKTELNKIISRQNNLASSLEYLKTDQGVENEIRSKFRVVKEGEKVSIIIDEQKTDEPVSTTTTENGFWYNIVNWFR
jgi:cell division protein FtsB